MWRNDISRPDVYGGMTYPDQVHVEEWHIRTRCMCRNDISETGHIHTSGPDVSFLHIQKGVLGSFVVKKKSFFFCFGSLSTTSEIHQDSAFFPSL
jgi:hypothetical protein